MTIIDSARKMSDLIMGMDGDLAASDCSSMTAEQAVTAAKMLRLLASACYYYRHQRDQGIHPLPVAPRSCHPYESEHGLCLFFFTEKQASDFTAWLLTLPVPSPEKVG